MITRTLLLVGCALAPLSLATPLHAQDNQPGGGEQRVEEEIEPTDAAEIIVTADIEFRNRTTDPNPVLSFDLEYFQRFEPVSVGEMLKRVPGVTFTSDVLEYDGVQLRGLPEGFTKVLINGKRPPGAGADRSFFVDRVPAELVERIEIIRAPTADQSSEGIAGTLNIVTKESAQFDGGFIKAGALINERDGEVRPSGAIAYADTIGDTSFWAALNYQGRRNPKLKVSDRFDSALFFSDREVQEDTRDGEDISGNAEITQRIGDGGRLRVTGLFVDTDRDEDETSLTFELDDDDPEDLGELFRPGADQLELDGVEIQRERISQQTYAIAADLELPFAGGEIGLSGGWNGFRDRTTEETDEGDTVAEAELDERLFSRIDDDEYEATAYFKFDTGALTAKFGVDYLTKERTGSLLEDGSEDEPAAGALFRIEEERIDPYVRLTYTPSETLTIDAGLRYEIDDGTVFSNADEETDLANEAERSNESLNPSLHLRYAPTRDDVFRASVARTVRRPDYDLISPFALEEEPADDNIFVGNPALRNQKAWGVDVGYERRLGARGIFGINAFYRSIDDLIELIGTGEEIDGFDVVSPLNVGDGDTYGVEVDVSAPLDIVGLPDTAVFANYTYLDSEVTDPFTGEERRFNNQPRHLYNIGFIQTVRQIDASFGASLGGRSKAVQSNFDETVELRYGQDLEAFVEKRFGRNFVLRLSAINLLDRTKREAFTVFDGDSFDEILDNRANGEFDEFELERENSGPLFQVTVRAAF